MFDENFWKLVDEEIALGYINVQKHPTEDLWIYNYGQTSMFDGRWNRATMHCRGLIVDKNKNVIARPFQKFFGKDQAIAAGFRIPHEEKFEVYDKLDGSLGILYPIKNSLAIATRGSFASDQAIEATKILSEKYGTIIFNGEWTYLFEIIYPGNRIVVNYGDERDLILLAIIETQTGKEIGLENAPEGLNIVKKYDGLKDIDKILEIFEGIPGTDKEGLVVKFESGFRIKVKTEDYKRLHKILSGINEKRIWECISNGQGLQEILDVVPDEFYNWIKSVEQRLRKDFERIEKLSRMLYVDAVRCADEIAPKIEIRESEKFQIWKKLHQKNFALFVLKCEDTTLRKVAFQLYHNLSYEELIWKSLEPVGNEKYKIIDDVEE